MSKRPLKRPRIEQKIFDAWEDAKGVSLELQRSINVSNINIDEFNMLYFNESGDKLKIIGNHCFVNLNYRKFVHSYYCIDKPSIEIMSNYLSKVPNVIKEVCEVNGNIYISHMTSPAVQLVKVVESGYVLDRIWGSKRRDKLIKQGTLRIKSIANPSLLFRTTADGYFSVYDSRNSTKAASLEIQTGVSYDFLPLSNSEKQFFLGQANSTISLFDIRKKSQDMCSKHFKADFLKKINCSLLSSCNESVKWMEYSRLNPDVLLYQLGCGSIGRYNTNTKSKDTFHLENRFCEGKFGTDGATLIERQNKRVKNHCTIQYNSSKILSCIPGLNSISVFDYSREICHSNINMKHRAIAAAVHPRLGHLICIENNERLVMYN